MWQISIDTGGTFTDCYGRDPNNNIFRFKVLSAGVLRGTVSSNSVSNIISFEHNWPIDEDIFKGYTFQKLNSNELIEIDKIDFSNQLIYLDLLN